MMLNDPLILAVVTTIVLATFYYAGRYLAKRSLVEDIIENVLECLEKDVDIVSDCVKLSIEAVNKQFNIRCDLGCDINFGNDWSEIH